MKSLVHFFKYIKPHQKIFFFALACGIIFGISSGFGIPVIFEFAFKKVFESQDHLYSKKAIAGIALLVPIVFLIRGIFGFLSTYYMHYCGLLVSKNLRKTLFEKIQYLPLDFFDKHKQGDLMSRLNGDSNTVQSVLLELASELFRQPIQILSAFIGLIYLSFRHNNSIFLIAFLLVTPLCLIPIRLIRSNIRKRSRQAQDVSGQTSHIIAENLSALLDIRSYCLEKQQLQKFEKQVSNYILFELKLARYIKLQQPFMEILAATFIGLVFVYAYFTKIPFSVFSAMGLALYFALDPLKKVNNILGNVHKCHGSIERINEILKAPSSIPDLQNQTRIDKIQGHISFSNVCFKYRKEYVLNDISIEIPAYTSCALVGPSGGGKSTLAKLLPKFYAINEGHISVDGVPIQDISNEALRNFIGIVPQHPVLFHDTIYNNILLAKEEASPEEVVTAAKNAFAHDFILGLEKDYNTVVGDRGDLLSGGQKQRIALARAFLKNAPILILDEATSALDSESEHYIQEALKRLSHNKTVLIIAHRLSTIQNADKIVVLEKGKIMGQGSHKQLLSTNELYKKLVYHQGLRE